MKSFVVSLLTVLLLLQIKLTIVDASGGNLGQDIHMWMFQEPNMSNPVLDADGLSLSMVYPISDYIKTNM